jgi:hypothetical protein
MGDFGMIPVPLIDFLEVDRWGDATLWVPVAEGFYGDNVRGGLGILYGVVEPDGRVVVG